MCVNVNGICEKELILFSGKVVYNDNEHHNKFLCRVPVKVIDGNAGKSEKGILVPLTMDKE